MSCCIYSINKFRECLIIIDNYLTELLEIDKIKESNLYEQYEENNNTIDIPINTGYNII